MPKYSPRTEASPGLLEPSAAAATRVSNRLAKRKPKLRLRIRMSYSPSWKTLVFWPSASTRPSGVDVQARERIDQEVVAADADLDQADLLAVVEERIGLGVEGDLALALEPLEQRAEPPRVGDQRSAAEGRRVMASWRRRGGAERGDGEDDGT